MEELTIILKGILDLGFPIVVAVFLLWKLPGHLDKLTQRQMEHTIGLYLILDNLGIVGKYEEKIKEFRTRKEDLKND